MLAAWLSKMKSIATFYEGFLDPSALELQK